MNRPELAHAITARRVERVVRDSLWTGFKLVIPLLVTLVVLGFAVEFVFRVLTPAATATEVASGGALSGTLLKLVTLLVLVAAVFVVGFVANRRAGRDDLAGRFDDAMGAIPGVGSVYSSSRRMSDRLIGPESRSFREVKLVEFADEGVYALGFLTDDAPTKVADATGDDVRTLFVPLSPNPFMGGMLVYIGDDHLYDVDMTVTQAASAVMTSGVTGSQADAEGTIREREAN